MEPTSADPQERGSRDPKWMVTATGLGMSAVAALVLLSEELSGASLSWAPWPLRVATYVVYLGAFVSATRPWSDRHPAFQRRLVAVMVISGCLLVGMHPGFGLLSALLVVTAVTVTYVHRLPVALGIVAGQSIASAVSLVLADAGALEVVVATAVYTLFQLFAVFCVNVQLRERAARLELDARNAELRAATALLAESSRATERLRIARELHDLIGHQLTALSLHLEAASQRLALVSARDASATAPAEVVADVHRAQSVAKDVLTDVRRAVGSLRAPTVDLADALRAIVADVPGLRVRLDLPDDLAVTDPARAHALVRVLQEAVTNALRHARARVLWVGVVRQAADLVLTVGDDGAGARVVRPGNGLTGMRERLEALGGSVCFTTEPGCGFAVRAALPLHDEGQTVGDVAAEGQSVSR